MARARFAPLVLALAMAGCAQTPPSDTASDTVAATAAAIALIGTVQGNPRADIPADQFRPPSGERPFIDAATAARMDVADYLAQGPSPWVPEKLAGKNWRADFTVAADGSGTHRTVQAAIDAVPARSANAARVVIQLKPGVYRERVCVPAGKAPISLVGEAADPSAAVIVGSAYGGQAKRPGVDMAHPCQPDLHLPLHSTPGSSTVIVAAADFQAANLTMANDVLEHVRLGVGYPAGASESGGAQGVALTTQADRVQLENVRLIGHQDTFYARRPAPAEAARVYVRGGVVAGDVDFIFGNATLVINEATIVHRGARRRPPNGGHVLAPSTPANVALGFLITRSQFLMEPGAPLANVSLGRAWDEGVAKGEWQPANAAKPSPNGQALIRDSLLGPHLALQTPWAASTSRRPFTAKGEQGNRMAEFNNTVLAGNPLAREVLSPLDGWAAAANGPNGPNGPNGTTTGGAAALPADVHTVRNRAELVAALAPHTGAQRPRIVQVQGTIDLSVDAQNRPLGFDEYRDPAFNWPEFEKAYDPATWGKKQPEGALEEARARSAKRQAAVVVVRLPSNTTLVGVGNDAHITHGNVMVERVDNVIVRNIRFSDSYDYFPAWDPKDNANGEWNSEYDTLTLSGATHVWVDHCTFDDGTRPDGLERVAFGRRMQHHDGLLDIIKQANHITVSWNVFRNHDKTTLVGNSDGRKDDEGFLKVSFHHNWYEATKERTPRVRYGQVHIFNNLFVGTTGGDYGYGYSIGVGVNSRVFSESNAWETAASVPPAKLTRWWKGQTFFDRGSLHNGQGVGLLDALNAANPAAKVSPDVGWTPWLNGPLEAAADVAARVRAGAGAGRAAGF
jgi:pectate lyase/pectin methylesterase-like acyl-CoA thioesterase